MSSYFKAIFRCDASLSIGGGHVMRCLTLADELSKSGWVCFFACSSETLKTMPIIHNSEYEVIPTNTSEHEADLLVVDHYNLNREYEASARNWANHILVLDDLANRVHDCDFLVDQTYGRAAIDYEPLVPGHCKILTGCDYALLSPQFAKQRKASLERRENQDSIKRVLISAGNTNIHKVTEKILDGISLYEDSALEIDVVMGSRACSLKDVATQIDTLNSESPHTLQLHTDVGNMAELMSAADIAIGTGGTTSWERCTLGLPAILVVIADNQKLISEQLEKAGACINLGWHADMQAEDVADALESLSKCSAHISKMSQSTSAICDGLGTSRAVEAVNAFSMPRKIILRLATIDDVGLLLAWRNDPQMRAASHNTRKVQEYEHADWLKATLEDEDRLLLIAEISDNPIGTVRADRDAQGSYELSWNLTIDARGQGLGKYMVARLMERIKGPIRAEIKKNNKASIQIAEYTGMTLQKENNGILYYEK